MKSREQKNDIYADIAAAFFAEHSNEKQTHEPALTCEIIEFMIENHWNKYLHSGEIRELKEFTPMVVGIIRVIWEFGIEDSNEILDFESIRDVIKIIVTYEKLAGNLPMYKYNLLILMMAEYLGIAVLRDDEKYLKEYLQFGNGEDKLPIKIENIVFEYIVNNYYDDYRMSSIAIELAENNSYSIKKSNDEKIIEVIKCIGREYFQCNNIC